MAVTFASHKKEVLEIMNSANEKALELVGEFLRGQAVLLCPVDTGNLRSSITYKTDATQKMVAVGTNVEYAIYVELGTGIYADNGKGRQTPWRYKNRQGDTVITHGMKPRRFITDSVMKNRQTIQRLYEDAVSRMMGKGNQ
jgi:HK97 gp10 family phage protein